MKRRHRLLFATVACAFGLYAAGVSPASGAHAESATRVRSATATTQAMASIRGMLISNANVDYRSRDSLDAPMRYVAGLTASTQVALDTFDARNDVTTRLVHLFIDPSPVWHNASSYMVYANLVFDEHLGVVGKSLKNVTWSDLFVSSRMKNGQFRVTDILPITPILHGGAHHMFDYAPSAGYAEMSAEFRTGLDQYAARAHYAAHKVDIKMFGYYLDAATRQLRVYLFVHNGLNVPAYAIRGTLRASLMRHEMFASSFALDDPTFGILFPGQTRFAVVTLPESSIRDRAALLEYRKNSTFFSQFVYRPL